MKKKRGERERERNLVASIIIQEQRCLYHCTIPGNCPLNTSVSILDTPLDGGCCSASALLSNERPSLLASCSRRCLSTAAVFLRAAILSDLLGLIIDVDAGAALPGSSHH